MQKLIGPKSIAILLIVLLFLLLGCTSPTPKTGKVTMPNVEKQLTEPLQNPEEQKTEQPPVDNVKTVASKEQKNEQLKSAETEKPKAAEVKANPCAGITCGTNEKCVEGKCVGLSCSERGGYECSQPKIYCNASLIAGAGIGANPCCPEPCTTTKECDPACSSTEKCVNGICKPKFCSEINGYICNKPNEVCIGAAVDTSDGFCCSSPCEDRTSCKNRDCGPFWKCVEGSCKLKTCAEYGGTICAANTLCMTKNFVDAEGNECCTTGCEIFCEVYPCQANRNCENGICVVKSCAEQNGYIYGPPSTQCYGTFIEAGDTHYCCSEPGKSQCELQPCSPNQSCVGGQCVYKTCAEQGGILCDYYKDYACNGYLTQSSETENSYQYGCCLGECVGIGYVDECSSDEHCDDGNPATIDKCETTNPRTCSHTPQDQCQSDTDCDDENPDTTDTCSGTPKQCSNTPSS